MLPTKGYFQDIECPYFDSVCNRPYCHFRHRKKGQEPAEEAATQLQKETEVPTYKPTPKSELASKSHIPISYVPDLAFRPDRTKRPLPKFPQKPMYNITATYNPTPLSILSSASKPDSCEDLTKVNDIKAILEIKQSITNVAYNPQISLQEPIVDIDFEDLSEEFNLIGDIIDDSLSVSDLNLVQDNKTNQESCVSEVEPKECKPVSHEKVDSVPENAGKLKVKDKSSPSHSKSHKSKHHKSSSKDRSSSKSSKHDKKPDKDKQVKDKHSHKSEPKRSHSSDDNHKSERKRAHNSDKHKTKERHRHKDSKSKDRGKKKSDKSKTKPTTKAIPIQTSDDSNSMSDNNGYIETDYNFKDNCSDNELDDNETFLECYRIFNEYVPPEKIETEAETTETVEEQPDQSAAGKKRIAHRSGEAPPQKPAFNKPKSQPSPALIMTNRLKLAVSNAPNEAEIKPVAVRPVSVKRPPPTLIEAARSLKLMKRSTSPKPKDSNLIDSILNGQKTVATKARKIAPVQNVMSIQRAKAKIEEIAKQKAIETISKTPAQTQKSASRVAHVPTISLSNIPDVLNADKSKLPVNVRTRFLTMIADECVKLYSLKDDAYNRALNEEFSCYEKCKVLITYKNSAMLAVNRLRKELQERQKSGLGPLGAGESSESNKSSSLQGKQFYDIIKKYLLSKEELDIHGYPRESSVPGHAVIKNRRNKPDSGLADNQRKCARCSKIYVVDKRGFAVYDEECLYHPLKKRTLRGEQTYLCCKSGDETGCTTANTHVTELSDGTDLEGFQTTMKPEREDDSRSYMVYALDCEMCYTVKGLELTRVTVVDSECKTVYETLVKPLNPIIDYNTSFSGITREQMERTSTNILQVQANILHLCNSKTILIGHSLESDMKALKIIHGTIIDTSVMFPHKMGLPHKRALRVLASEILQKIIQNSVGGHDSAEDAITCMELVKWKVREELKVRGLK